GGETWSRQESGTLRWLHDIVFASQRSGWAVGDDGLILRTDDGGQTWLVQISGTPTRLLGISLRAERRLYIVGQNGVALRSDDGGRQWEQEATGASTTLTAVAFIDGEGWTVGRDGVILRYAGLGAGKFRTILNR
ncbi:MAG: WD40/YVTN/BNR-like repeat-containing protein, partial [Acidobacteriota bacterium]